MEDARAGRILGVHVRRLPQHVGAGMAVEHEAALAIGAQRHERQRRPRRLAETQAAHIHPRLRQRIRQEMAEVVVADLAHETGAIPQTGHAHGHIGWRASGGLLEGGRLGKRHT